MHWTEAEYLGLEHGSPIKHEYLEGEIYAMAGARPEHNFLCARMIAALEGLIGERRCQVFTSDQRIHVPATGLYTYPDGGVVCGKPELHPADPQMSLTNPLLLIEVLSPSNRDYDRGPKLEHYRQIPSLMEVLHVWTEKRLIEQHVRDGAAWRQMDHTAGSFQSLGGTLSVDAIYRQLVE